MHKARMMPDEDDENDGQARSKSVILRHIDFLSKCLQNLP